jgi:small-conductance mechanosensitive channel
MNLSALWTEFRAGELPAGYGWALLGSVLILGLLLDRAVFRPLLKFLLSGTPDSAAIRARRRREDLFAHLAILAAASWTLLHAITPAAERLHRVPYQASLLAVVLLTAFVAFDVALVFFGDFVPVRGGRAPMSQFFKDVLRTVALLVCFFGALKLAFPGTDVGNLLATSAVLSLVVGLALQESLSNVFGGLMLTVDQPYKPGDWIEIDGKEGKVLDSNWRSVRVLTRDDDVIYVPNRVMANANIINFSAPTHLHRIRRSVGVEYGAPPNKVRQALLSVMSRVEGVLATPPGEVFVLDYADFAVVYEMRFWIDRYVERTRIESDVMRGVWYQLKRNGIAIPFPIRDVYLRREKPATSTDEVAALLRKVDILASLKEPELRVLAEDLTTQIYAKGEAVCRQGEEGSTFYIIRSGQVAVTVTGEQNSGLTGVEAEVARLGPGAYFGEMSLLTGESRKSTVRALEDCEVLSLDRESFGVLIRDNPAIAQTMSEVIADRATASQQRLVAEHQTRAFAKRAEEPRSRDIFEKIRAIFRFR